MMASDVLRCLHKVCASLDRYRVAYIIVGGAAVSHYGYNRPSGIGNYKPELKVDLYFWYKPTIENFHRLVDALTDIGVDTKVLRGIVFNKDKTFLKIPHDEFHTDFLPVIEGLNSFRECKDRAEIVEVDGLKLPVLSYDDLIINKRHINRINDQADIDELEKIRKGKRRRMSK